MSSGIMVCGSCRREVHQNGPKDANDRSTWLHCEDKTALCPRAVATYPPDKNAIVGRYCGMDAM